LRSAALFFVPLPAASAGGWANIALPRIVTIAWLNGLGIHWFDGVAVVSYAIPLRCAMETGSYSFRLTVNFGAGTQYESYLRNIRRKAQSNKRNR
jgi:non-heme chloroperoxidase